MPRILRPVTKRDRLLDLAQAKGCARTLAAVAKRAGISKRELQRYLNHGTQPEAANVAKLATALGVAQTVVLAVLEAEP